MTSFQSNDVMLHAMSSAMPNKQKMDPQPGQIRFDIKKPNMFTQFQLGSASTFQSKLNFAPCDFWLFFFSKLKERLAGRKFIGVQDLSKAIRHFRAQRFGSLYQYALQMRLRRLEICVASGGMYSEGV